MQVAALHKLHSGSCDAVAALNVLTAGNAVKVPASSL